MNTLVDKTGAPVTVARNDGKGAYEITLVDDGVVAGSTFFLDRDHDGANERVFYHTGVDEAFGGRGLATVLVREAVDATREAGLLIVPVCPLVRSYLTKNADAYDGSFRHNRPEDAVWVQERLAQK